MTTGRDKPFFPVDAIQLFGTRDPGFVWEATATMAWVVPIRVVDAYAGKGWLEVRIAGTIPVASATGADSDALYDLERPLKFYFDAYSQYR